MTLDDAVQEIYKEFYTLIISKDITALGLHENPDYIVIGCRNRKTLEFLFEKIGDKFGGHSIEYSIQKKEFFNES